MESWAKQDKQRQLAWQKKRKVCSVDEEESGTTEGARGSGKEGVGEVNPHYRFEDADVILIDAQVNMKFKCHSYCLMTGSRVFKDMITCCSTKSSAEPMKIILTDEEHENADTVSRLLDCFYNRWDDYFNQETPIPTDTLRSLVILLKKYDCPRITVALSRMIGLFLHQSSHCPLSAFIVGANLEDVNLCVTAVAHPGRWTWSDTGLRLEDGIQGRLVLDLGAISRRDFSHIPSDYSHALIRATSNKVTDQSDASRWDWPAIAEEFRRLMEDQKSASTDKQEKLWLKQAEVDEEKRKSSSSKK